MSNIPNLFTEQDMENMNQENLTIEEDLKRAFYDRQQAFNKTDISTQQQKVDKLVRGEPCIPRRPAKDLINVKIAQEQNEKYKLFKLQSKDVLDNHPLSLELVKQKKRLATLQGAIQFQQQHLKKLRSEQQIANQQLSNPSLGLSVAARELIHQVNQLKAEREQTEMIEDLSAKLVYMGSSTNAEQLGNQQISFEAEQIHKCNQQIKQLYQKLEAQKSEKKEKLEEYGKAQAEHWNNQLVLDILDEITEIRKDKDLTDEVGRVTKQIVTNNEMLTIRATQRFISNVRQGFLTFFCVKQTLQARYTFIYFVGIDVLQYYTNNNILFFHFTQYI
ncbi:Hypothetical_protein [Hexamita inflata]|uniref:Hypothetical_protein n=1 Tax=Hexamita inflata TaxID=28002 RepID=A0ABP1HJZ4_9EUKA